MVPTAASAATSPKATSPKAKAQLLRLSDFPPGWQKSTGSTTSSSGTTSQFAQIASCEGISESTVKITVPDASTGFSKKKKTAQFTVELVGVWPSAATAKKVYALFSSPKAPTCVGKLLSQSVAAGTATGNVSASDVTVSKLPMPRLGSASTAIGLAIPVTLGGTKVTMNADFVTIQEGSSLAVVAPIGLSATVPTAFTVSIAKKAAARLR